MPRAILLFVLGLAILGCSKRAPPVRVPAPQAPAAEVEVAPAAAPTESEPLPEPEPVPDAAPSEPIAEPEVPRSGGRIRALADAGESPETFLQSLAVPDRMFADVEDWVVEGSCYRVPVLGWADAPSAAAGLVEAWDAELASGRGALDWILALESAPGLASSVSRKLVRSDLRARNGAIQVCGAGSVVDVQARLEHPALRGAATLRSSNAAPFQRVPEGGLVRNPTYVGAGPYADRVDPVAPGGELALLFKLGDVDVAIVHGRDVRALEAAPEQVALERVPSRDPTYFLWLNPDKHWLNAPSFRRWLASAIDRAEIVRLLFDGRGRRAYTLRPDGRETPAYEMHPDPPLAPTSRPRLDLQFDESDRTAELLAARLRATLGGQRLELRLRPTSQDRLLEDLDLGQVEAALLVHRPETPDPVLGLLGAVWWLGAPVEAETRELLRATALATPAARAAEAARIEEQLLTDARVVPIVRLDAWLATNLRLAGVEVEPHGSIRLGAAWWRR